MGPENVVFEANRLEVIDRPARGSVSPRQMARAQQWPPLDVQPRYRFVRSRAGARFVHADEPARSSAAFDVDHSWSERPGRRAASQPKRCVSVWQRDAKLPQPAHVC